MKRLALAMTLVATPAAAQVSTDEAAWINLTVQGPVEGKMVYFVEAQPRLHDGVSRLGQFLARGAIGRRLNDRVTLYQGYARVVDYRAGGDQIENRSFQQATWNVAKGPLGELQSRTRFEQRFVEGSRDMGLRLRQMARWKLPLRKRPRSVAALASVEGFVALNDTNWGAAAGFDQARLFGGAEIPLFGTSTIETGYQAQIANLPAGGARVRHTAILTVQIRH